MEPITVLSAISAELKPCFACAMAGRSPWWIRRDQSGQKGRTAVILSRMMRTVRLAGLALATLSFAAAGAQPETARFGEEIHVFSIEDEVRPAPECATDRKSTRLNSSH